MSVATSVPMLHAFIGGVSRDVPLAELDIGNASSDDQIKAAVASFFEQPLSKFSAFVVDRDAETGNVTVRPQAVWG